jgi:hypothetical protein
MEHMAIASAMRGGVIDRSLPAVLSAASSLCNLTVIPGRCASIEPGMTSRIEERFLEPAMTLNLP